MRFNIPLVPIAVVVERRTLGPARFRFGLRTVLLLVAIAAVALEVERENWAFHSRLASEQAEQEQLWLGRAAAHEREAAKYRGWAAGLPGSSFSARAVGEANKAASARVRAAESAGLRRYYVSRW